MWRCLAITPLRPVSYNSHNSNSCSNGYASTTRAEGKGEGREITLFYHVYTSLEPVALARYLHEMRDVARKSSAHDSITEYRAVAGAINKFFPSAVYRATVLRTFNFIWKNPIFNPIVIKFLEKEAPPPQLFLRAIRFLASVDIENTDFVDAFFSFLFV